MSDGRNVIYIYDGSFEGLLCAIFESYYRHEIPISITDAQNLQEELFSTYKTIETDHEKYMRVTNAIENKISHRALLNLYYTYLSDAKDKGKLCLDYARAGFKFGDDVDMHLNIECVSSVIRSVRRILSEAHQYRGFVRFSELTNGIYYSEIKPKCNILPIIMSHFKRRFPSMPWIIHDTFRKLCIVYNGKECYITDTDSVADIKYSEDEQYFRMLWKNFYDTIEIKERHNERCRMSHMPKRFWEFMPEMQGH